MQEINAIGFDLFNTLIMAEHQALNEAVQRLIQSLEESGLEVDHKGFRQAYRKSALRFIEETRKKGRETHNRFWISAALKTQGYTVSPDDPRIAEGVRSYFSVFLEYCHPIPGATEMLERLKGHYRLGLLSNFTHGPAARGIIEHMDFAHFFDVILISGELGYCKPHPLVFRKLAEDLGVQKSRLLYVGDDPLVDIQGALQAGIRPVWTTYVRDNSIPFTPGNPPDQTEVPENHVPRVSTWNELLSLLKKA